MSDFFGQRQKAREEFDILGLSVRASNALTNSGICSIEQLVSKKPSELLRLHNLGIKSLREIEEALREKGLFLREMTLHPVDKMTIPETIRELRLRVYQASELLKVLVDRMKI